MTQICSSLFLSLLTLSFSPFNLHRPPSTHSLLFLLFPPLFIPPKLSVNRLQSPTNLSCVSDSAFSWPLFNLHVCFSISLPPHSPSLFIFFTLLLLLVRHSSSSSVHLASGTGGAVQAEDATNSVFINSCEERERANTQHRLVGRAEDPGLTRGRSRNVARTLVWV